MNPIKHIDLHNANPLKLDIVDSPVSDIMFEIANKIRAKAVEADTAIYEAIVKEAIKDGVSDLYILDKKFIFEAIREKMEREGVVK